MKPSCLLTLQLFNFLYKYVDSVQETSGPTFGNEYGSTLPYHLAFVLAHRYNYGTRYCNYGGVIARIGI